MAAGSQAEGLNLTIEYWNYPLAQYFIFYFLKMRKLKITAFILIAVTIFIGSSQLNISKAIVGQWSATSSTLFYTDGNVAIGNSIANAPLHLAGTDTTIDKILLKIGNIPERSWYFTAGKYGNAQRGDYALVIGQDTYTDCTACKGDIQFKPGKNFIISQGNVGIGDSNPAYKLSVNGTIRAKEIRVNSNWADYVFEDDYKLIDINSLENYIVQNNHLPNVPSAQTVESEGLDVSEMQKIQMEKIEELTLYIIELNKRIEELEAKVE